MIPASGRVWRWEIRGCLVLILEQAKSHRLFGLPAIPVIFVCVTAWLAGFLFATNAILDGPYLGAVFKTNAGMPGVVVTWVSNEGPASRAGLENGAVIRAIAAPASRMVLSDVSGVHDRSETNTYDKWTRVTRERPALWDMISSGDLVLELEAGENVSLRPADGRSWSSLPAEFWISAVHGLAVLLICVGIAVFATPSILINLLYLTGLCLSANILCHALRSAGEFVFSPGLSGYLYVASNVSAVLFAFALLALLWHTPRPGIRLQFSRLPFARLALGFAVFAFLVQHFQWFAFPIHPFQFPYLLAIVLAIALTAAKWIASRGKPVDRAVLSWVLLSIFAAVVPWAFVFSLPIALGGVPLANPNLSGLILTLVFIGFGFGAFKYRLFGMRMIWRRSLIWLSIGICVLLVDLVLLTRLQWTPQQALTTAVLLASWVYFPIKGFVDALLANKTAISVEHATRTLFERFASIPDLAEFDGRLVRFLKDQFKAQNVGIVRGECLDHATIRDDGFCLAIPAVGQAVGHAVGPAGGQQDTYVLSGRNDGQALFSAEDRKIADILSELATGIFKQKAVEFEKRTEDREQIIRDLHDDVGAKLLNLIFAAPVDSRLRTTAEQALKALKDSFLTIEDFEDLDLESNWAEIWKMQCERLTSTGLRTDFVSEFTGSRIIGARDLVNMKRILDEHVSNILKYADKTIVVEGSARLRPDGDFVVQLRNGRTVGQTFLMAGGRGFANMQARAKESSAEIRLGNAKSLESSGEAVENNDVPVRADSFAFYFRLPLERQILR